MKKYFSKLIAVVLACVCLFSFSACDKNSNSGSSYTPPSIRPEVKFTDKAFVVNGASDYKLVLPKDYHSREMVAADEFNAIFSMSTGFELGVVFDDEVEYTAKDKFISLGQTEYLEKFNVKPDYNELSTQGYVMKTIDNCVIIAGATSNGFGTIYGVYDFLARQIDYECYALDEVYVKKVENINLVDVDLTDKPDVPNSIRPADCYVENAEYQNRHRFIAHTDLFLGNMDMYHSSFKFLNPTDYKDDYPEWYSTHGNQICYTARGDEDKYNAMVEQLFNIFLAEIEKVPEIVHVGFSINDNGDFCNCDTCSEKASYFGGSNAALIINFLNDLSDRFAKYYSDKGEEKELQFMFFVYKTTFQPPTQHIEEATCNDNVYPFVCTFNANRVEPFTGPNNADTRAAIEGWEKVASKMAFWTYSANYNNYIFPADTFNCLQENLQYLKSKNPVYYKNEAVGDNYHTTGFYQLKYYLEYKLSWNTELNMDELIKDYFNHYFQDAAQPMYEYFTRFRLSLARAYNEFWWTHYDNSNFPARNLSFSELRVWQSLIDKAFESIEYLKIADKELYDKLYSRIALESICPDYMIMYLYSTKISSAEKNEIKQRLKYRSELTNLMWADDYGNPIVSVIDKLN